MIWICLVVSLVALGMVLSPFYFGGGGTLAPASAVQSEDRLEQMKRLLLEQYLKEEAQAGKGELSQRSWAKRQIFLTNRYVDFAKQHDHLRYLARNGSQTVSKEEAP